MSARTVYDSTLFPVVGLSVSISILFMIMGLLQLPAQLGWAVFFMIPVVGFALLVHRNNRGAPVNQKASTAMVLILVVAGTIVPRFAWEGTAVVALAAISLVLGVVVGMLVHSSYLTTGKTTTTARGTRG